MKFGFDLFNINYVPSPDLQDVEEGKVYFKLINFQLLNNWSKYGKIKSHGIKNGRKLKILSSWM